MKIEIRSHFWPATPHLREIKVFIDGKEYISSFMKQDEIFDLAKQFRQLDHVLTEIAYTVGETT